MHHRGLKRIRVCVALPVGRYKKVGSHPSAVAIPFLADLHEKTYEICSLIGSA
jgi:hypothetical protein